MGKHVAGKREKIFRDINVESKKTERKSVKRKNKENVITGNATKKSKTQVVESMPDAIAAYNSVVKGKSHFSKMISPFKISQFFKDYWEKKPMYIARENPAFYKHVCTVEDFKNALANEEIYFSENIDVTNYINGVRTTENHEGRATPKLVYNFYNSGKSIRLVNPQTFIRKVRVFTTKLQDYFRCFVGSNIYLTPGNSQGFAPHFDDVEAFVLQLDGRKEWRVYNPRPGEELARFSSANFTDKDIGKPILKVILEPGDLLYFPRGVIHQARSLKEGSMHITVSCYQRNSWADFLEKLLPVALQTAIEEDVEYRKGLPKTYLDHLGLVASDTKSKERSKIISHVKHLVNKLTEYLPIDSCADQFGKNYMHDALPPILTKGERKYSGGTNRKGLKQKLRNNWNKNLKVKLIRAYSCRLVCEEEKFRLYYNTKNGLVYHEVDYCFIELSHSQTAVADVLLQQYPSFTSVKELVAAVSDAGDLNDVLDFLEVLSKKGLLLFNRILTDDNESRGLVMDSAKAQTSKRRQTREILVQILENRGNLV